ncbi:CU044_5270 family protein [Streptosporangium sp. NBC_01495]|uniref:CU044_5270 family protein n=1 Tax=Streptosporangium sp. NBC_01495 TaxID=2903899 RepID=UPI002E32C508|nr:CU044_5270 family protein [Streptosporangium sp. NBC_01495]
MDDYQAVRELLSVPPLSPGVERAGRERLGAAFARERARSRRRVAGWSALGLGLAGAAAALVVTSAAPPTPPAPRGVIAAQDSKRFLLAAATSVASVPDEGAWWGSTLVSGREFRAPGGGYTLRQSRSEETWIPADPEASTWYRWTYLGAGPATPRDETAWRADGAPTSWTYDGKDTPGLPTEDRALGVVRAAPGKPDTFSSEDWDFRIVMAGRPLTKMNELPGTPEGVRELLKGPDDRSTVDNVARLLFFAPVTSETRAAAYRLLASMPEVAAVGQVTDELGRTGQAIEYRSAEFPTTAYAGETRTRLVIDPNDGRPLSIETRSVADGTLLEFTAVRESHWAHENPLKEKK